MSNLQNETINEDKKEFDKEPCGLCAGTNENHMCNSCEQELTKKECKQFDGLCEQCMWLLDK